jgi:hypothetical protein
MSILDHVVEVTGGARTAPPRPDNVVGGDAALFEGLGLDTGACARAGDVCVVAVPPLLAAIVEVGAGVSGSAEPAPATAAAASAVAAAAARLHCDDERCVVGHPAVAAAVRRAHGAAAPAILARGRAAFKTPGPRDSRALLNNVMIDGTLARWAAEFTRFYPYPFCMIDFAETNGPLARTSLVAVVEGRAPAPRLPDGTPLPTAAPNMAACVLNTDVSSGPGKHWVAVFFDARAEPWTIEYFNSVGRPPPRQVVRWMEQERAALAAAFGRAVETAAVTSVAHQRGDTECGLYALYFIRRRLVGTPAAFFAGDPIPDDAIAEFRRYVFV